MKQAVFVDKLELSILPKIQISFINQKMYFLSIQHEHFYVDMLIR